MTSPTLSDDLCRRALQVLATLVWCHENEETHLLGKYAFERLFDEAWASAIKLLKEPRSSGPSSSSPAPAISHEEMARFLGEAIRVEIFDEGALVRKARFWMNGDPDVPLSKEETAENVGTIIWEKGRTGDIALAAKNCGAIQGYFHVARHYDITLPPEVKALEEWGDTINPA
jgi:hypothetical protein